MKSMRFFHASGIRGILKPEIQSSLITLLEFYLLIMDGELLHQSLITYSDNSPTIGDASTRYLG